ncbi:MAG: hypothetical protein SGPRY_009492 [Prymnesium sp.]
MPPNGWRKPPTTETGAAMAGLSKMTAFFARLPQQPKRGRPSKEPVRSAAGGVRPCDDPDASLRTASAAVEPPDDADPLMVEADTEEIKPELLAREEGPSIFGDDAREAKSTKTKVSRTNWRKGETCELLVRACDDWKKKTGVHRIVR